MSLLAVAVKNRYGAALIFCTRFALCSTKAQLDSYKAELSRLKLENNQLSVKLDAKVAAMSGASEQLHAAQVRRSAAQRATLLISA